MCKRCGKASISCHYGMYQFCPECEPNEVPITRANPRSFELLAEARSVIADCALDEAQAKKVSAYDLATSFQGGNAPTSHLDWVTHIIPPYKPWPFGSDTFGGL